MCPRAAICPQGCRNGGLCVAPGICSCPEGWLGGACHTGESNLSSHRPKHCNMHQCTLQARLPLSLFFLLCPFKDLFPSVSVPGSHREDKRFTAKQNDINQMSASAQGTFSAQCFSRCDRHGNTFHLCFWVQGVWIYKGLVSQDFYKCSQGSCTF